jgi:hypothetical protein
VPFGSPVESQGGSQEGRKQVYAGPTQATKQFKGGPKGDQEEGRLSPKPCKAIGKPIQTLLNYMPQGASVRKGLDGLLCAIHQMRNYHASAKPTRGVGGAVQGKKSRRKAFQAFCGNILKVLRAKAQWKAL